MSLGRLLAVSILAFGGLALAAPEADAHGWRRHHRHHHGRLHYYGPRYDWQAPRLSIFGFPCHLQKHITYYGALAYRQVCYY